jgi:hypothetical protein
MKISSVAIPGTADKPYTFDQTRSLALNYLNLCKDQIDALIIADHRNLFLTADDISRILLTYQQDPGKGVISLAFCKDYPCQFRSYLFFLGCSTIRFNRQVMKTETSDRLRIDFTSKMISGTKRLGEIKTEVSVKGSRICANFHSESLPTEKFMAQVLPFDKTGPLFKKSQEIVVKTPEHETMLETGADHLAGIMFLFNMPSQSGEYDAIEFFTPENATWQLGESVSTVFNKKNLEPLFNRQQFPLAYTYDGSLCVLGREHLTGGILCNPIPRLLNDGFIVTDWVDYWYTVSVQRYKGKREI